MKIKFFASILMICCLMSAGCSENDLPSTEFLVLMRDTTANSASIHQLTVSNNSLCLLSTPYFSLPDDNYNYDTIVYWDSDKIAVSFPSFDATVDSDKTVFWANPTDLFFEDWSLTRNDATWILSNSDIGYSSELAFDVNGRTYFPICFYVDTDIHVLCSSLTRADEFSVCVFIFDVDTHTIRTVCCDDSFHKYDISPVMYPADSFQCYPLVDGFLYNEGANIYHIDGVSGEMQILFNESMIMNDIPLKDSYREVYWFFDSASFCNDHYMLSIPAYNELSGWYVALYDSNLIYKGCVYITETQIVLYDANNKKISHLEGAFYAYCYL